MDSVVGGGGVPSAGLPHSEIPGSKLDCSSPRRIAAYRVLRRPFAPRHPPRALRSLNNSRKKQGSLGKSGGTDGQGAEAPAPDHPQECSAKRSTSAHDDRKRPKAIRRLAARRAPRLSGHITQKFSLCGCEGAGTQAPPEGTARPNPERGRTSRPPRGRSGG